MTTRLLWLLACVGCAVDAGADDDDADDDRAADDGDDTSGAGGALLYEYAGEAVRFELATRTERTLGLQSGITERIGRSGDLMTDVLVRSDDAYVVNVRRLTSSGFEHVSSVPPFGISTGFITGSVQPTANATQFAMHTRERAELGAPETDHIYVFDASAQVQMRLREVGYPVWLPGNRIAMRAADGLYTSTIGASPTINRLGPQLTNASEPARHLAVSPDGSAIAFVQDGSVWRIDVDGTNLVRLTQPAPAIAWPAWSPDGKRLAVVEGVCSGERPTSVAALISSTQPDQSITSASRVMREPNLPLVVCGAMFWLP